MLEGVVSMELRLLLAVNNQSYHFTSTLLG